MISGMEHAEKLQGRSLSRSDVEFIRQLMLANPQWSRRKLSIEVCHAWNWHNGAGQLKDMACRSLLLKLHARGSISLPARRQQPTNRMTDRVIAQIPHSTASISERLASVRPIGLIDVREHEAYAPLYRCLLSRYHYLGYRSPVGENMQYLVVDRSDRPLACLLFSSAAWSCVSRDQYIGWTATQRQQNLQMITNNTRFLVLPWVQVAHLASHLLALICRRISDDWLARYGHRVHFLETFVDQSRYAGTCYRAANWCCVGQTRGRSRNDRYTNLRVPVKSVFVYALTRHYQARLQCESPL